MRQPRPFARVRTKQPRRAAQGAACGSRLLIAAPEDAIGAHLNVMARLSYLMKSEKNRQKLMSASSPGDVLALMDNID